MWLNYKRGIPLTLALISMPHIAQASDAKIDSADTAFMTIATALVLMMTVPGLALFYSGMVRRKNILALMAQSVAATALISILWYAFGYSLSFSGSAPWIGNLDRLFLAGVDTNAINPLAPTIPEILFFLFQMTFAVITCALIGGAVTDRFKFSAFLLFSSLWLLIVYVPSAHLIWGGGYLSSLGVVDFAGGIVVHINAGVAGLVAALVLGPRQGFGRENLAPFDLSMAIVGTGLLWVGWFGFNGGSALSIGPRAIFAITSTHLAACAGAAAWTTIEWLHRGKPSVLGIISGVVAGLGTVTPASGFILPWHGLVIGTVAGSICYWCCTVLKHKLKYDDSLDVFGVHGVGGIIGSILVGVFATSSVSKTATDPGISGLLEGNHQLLLIQIAGVIFSVAFCAVGTWIALKITGAICGLRVSAEEEREGLDLSLHGEALHQ